MRNKKRANEKSNSKGSVHSFTSKLHSSTVTTNQFRFAINSTSMYRKNWKVIYEKKKKEMRCI